MIVVVAVAGVLPFGIILPSYFTLVRNTMQCRYNAVHFLPNPHNRHPIARPWGRGMGCLLWFWYLTLFLPLLSYCCKQYHDKLGRVITALDCTNTTAQHTTCAIQMYTHGNNITCIHDMCSIFFTSFRIDWQDFLRWLCWLCLHDWPMTSIGFRYD